MSNVAIVLKRKKVFFIALDSLNNGLGRCLVELVSL